MDPNYGYPQEQGFFSQIGSHIIDFIQTFVIFGAIFALIYLFAAQPHRVSGNSMLPTFYDGDYILTDKISYRLGEPKRGDVIVLQNPRNESEDFIKRIIALPNDSIMIQSGQVYINNIPLQETYLPAQTVTQGGNFLNEGETLKIPTDQYFVIGDNRNHSSDSREWGPVTKKEIVGKTFFRYFPLQRFGLFKPLP